MTVRIVRRKANESIRGRFSFSERGLPVDKNSCQRPALKAATDGVRHKDARCPWGAALTTQRDRITGTAGMARRDWGFSPRRPPCPPRPPKGDDEGAAWPRRR